MKELHNHIFSNTTCISKETMLKYINKQLTTKELHEVEKHLVDCEFCSEAMEGIKYAENSSILFAIDNEIDQRVRMGETKSPVMRNLMVAASILILVCGAYFTFDYFEGAVEQQSNLALKEDAAEADQSVTKEYKPSKDGFVEEALKDDQAVTTKNQLQANDDRFGEQSETSGGVVVQVPEMIEEIEMEDEETVVDALDMDMEIAADEAEEQAYYREPVDEIESVVVTAESANNNESTSTNSGTSAVEKVAKTTERKKNDDSRNRSNKDKQKSKGSKKRSMSPSYKSETRAEMADNLELANQRTTVTMSTYQVIDYTQEYQALYDQKNSVESNSVPAGFATEEDKMLAEKEKEELEVEVTYKATLEKAMAYMKANKYVQALDQFAIILKEHPQEANAQFYGGVSYFELKQYEKALAKFNQAIANKRQEFNDDARWYKALTLIELSRKQEAIDVLENMPDVQGFYRNKIDEKLKELKK